MKKEMIKFLILLLVALGSAPAYSAYWQWSRTAATNASADPTINFAEGMSPSSVNDSARALMARAAEQRDDVSGLLATGGTSTAYTVTTFQVVNTPTPTNGQMISITPHATNGASATLAADGGTAFPIRTDASSAVAAGVLVSGTPYDLKFNSSASAWILKGFFANPFNVPLGAVLDYSGAAIAPNSNFALANGQCISRATYSAYFALVSTSYGACDGSTTFGVPDLSNRYVAGGAMGGTPRITVAGGNFDATNAGATGGSQNHTLTTAQLPATTPSGTISAYTPSGSVSVSTPSGSVSVATPTGSVSTTINGQSAGVVIQNNTGPAATTAGGANWTVATLTATSSFTGNALSASFTGNAASGSFTGNPASLTFSGTSFGSGASHPIIPPTMILNKIVRIF